MRVMTFNLRFETAEDGPFQWKYRKELVLETIWAYQPDLIGTQEGTVPQLDYLTAHLTGYLPFVAHRHIDPTCQYPTIFYRAQNMVPGPGTEFWLSTTPGVHRSKDWGSAFPRMVTLGQFREIDRDQWFYFADTHLDHISEPARLMGARIIQEYFAQVGQPTILAGDFNDHPGSEVHRLLVEDGSPFRDTWTLLNRPEAEITTQHKFTGELFGHRIDWVLITPPFRVREAMIITYNVNGRYPSDHFPYLVDLEY
ncbi:MAG: endonuclease/exonuclease/phosphatase family protein [Deltaproteobacteria bacterium]|nr:endonuclease/exonuclease/phosphatase family protein [Deltaproteobacteria bacterium]